MILKKKKVIITCDSIVKELAGFLLKSGLSDKFQVLAKKKQKDMVSNNISINELMEMIQKPPDVPPSYSVKKHGLGGWLSACQFSIFELIYNFGESALPMVRENAWGEYDWTQGNAIELLIRFAAKGIKREEIISEIKENFPKIRHEARLYAIQPFIPKFKKDPEIKKVFKELMQVEDFKESYEELLKEKS